MLNSEELYAKLINGDHTEVQKTFDDLNQQQKGYSWAGKHFKNVHFNFKIYFFNFDNCTFEDCSFASASMYHQCHFTKARFFNNEKDDSIFLAGQFNSCTLNDMTFEKTHIFMGEFNSTLLNIKLTDCVVTMGINNALAVGTQSKLLRTEFRGPGCNINAAHGTQFTECEFHSDETVFIASTLTIFNSCTFSGTKILHTKIGQHAIFNECDFSKTTFHSTANFNDGHFNKCKISRISLAQFEPTHKPAMCEILKMEIVDDLAELRNEFSGFWQYVHTFGLMLFLAPYLYFIALAVAKTSLAPQSDQETPLIMALLKYAFYPKSITWVNWFCAINIIVIVFQLSYNALRVYLLYQTKTLELSQETRGLPVIYQMDNKHERLFNGFKIMFWINVIIIGIHIALFFSRPVAQ